ncbi:hypothetical protein RUM44_011876 [Polyplax serrata]|uniref:RNA helicase n=1 Tax=Polyplax serrata TaxID=468196 RepID=A0ABR1BE62_POLSC
MFNHHKNMDYSKFDIIPLASKAWHHKKSKGDYFTILPTTQHPAFIAPNVENIPCTFEETKLSSVVIDQLKKINAEFPTTIQAKSIPEILKGKSTLIAAETGCGKTLAYLAPIVDNILKWKDKLPIQYNSPLAVILLPTRELAIQVGNVANELCTALNIKCITLLGGKLKKLLLSPLYEKTDILVCSLGAFSKLLTHNTYTMKYCKHFVLDEADTLLDDTFNDKVKYIIRKSKLNFGTVLPTTPNKTQLYLISATMPTNVDTLLEHIIREDGLEQISTNYLHKIQSHIPQKFIRVSPSQKSEELLKIVKSNMKKSIPTMIFSNRTKTSNFVNLFLNENGIKSIRLNKQMEQQERLEQYQKFRDGIVNVISCTDIASRGLDSTRVKHIINYEFPMFVSDYIHRCGRTGRIGHDENCLVTSFISQKKELPLLHSIEKSARLSGTLENVNNNKIRLLRERVIRKDPVEEFLSKEFDVSQ